MSSIFENMNSVFRNSRCALSEAVTFKLNSGATAKTIYVNFFNEASEAPFGESNITRKEPMCMANTDDVSTCVPNQSQIIRNGVTYYIAKSDPDDDGETVLYLSKNQY
ncbi:MAG: hypothetical protein IPL84_03775 [Chitinophagaceae bacterium]|nr:hypothetical protein [Chitinophagaceae bacterium]